MRSLLIAFLICGFAAAGFLGWQYYQSEQSREHLLAMNTAVSDFLATLETKEPSPLGGAAAELARKFTGDDAARFRDVLENAFASRIRKNPGSRQELVSVLQTLYPHSALAAYIGTEEDRAAASYYSAPQRVLSLPVKDVSAPAVKTVPAVQAAPALPAVKTAPALPAVKREVSSAPKAKAAPAKKAAAVAEKKAEPAAAKKTAVAAAAKPEKPNPSMLLVQSAWKGDVQSLRAALAAGADPQMRVRGQNGKVTSLLSALLVKTKQMPVPGKMIPVIIELMKAGAAPTERDRELIASIPELAGALE